MSVVICFISCLLLFVIIGALSYLKSSKSTYDYLMANQDIPPFFVAMSAIATNNSGYMFVGMIGYTYLYGLSSIWLLIGWIAGDFCASLYIHKKIRMAAGQYTAMSYPELLCKWGNLKNRYLQIFMSLLLLTFLCVYAAAQLKAGSKALHVVFSWNYSVGSILGSIIVLIYCFAGGLRASMWTDVAQSCVMILTMTLLVVYSIDKTSGIHAFFNHLYSISPQYMSLFPPNNHFGHHADFILFLLGWLFAGFGVVGQPHIMSRFMVLRAPENMTRVRCYYYCWYIAFSILTIFAAFSTRILLPAISNHDVELALPKLSLQLFPGALVGITLAGLFSATMSTADSQILACTASITRDFTSSTYFTYVKTKVVMVMVTLLALFIALSGHQSVFSLVILAWSALAVLFAPIVLLLAMKQKLTVTVTVLMMITGFTAMIIWRELDLSSLCYEVLPGISTSMAVFVVTSLLRKKYQF